MLGRFTTCLTQISTAKRLFILNPALHGSEMRTKMNFFSNYEP